MQRVKNDFQSFLCSSEDDNSRILDNIWSNEFHLGRYFEIRN